MNNNDKMMVNSIPVEVLAATRMSLLNVIQNAEIPHDLRSDLKEIIAYIESRMRDNGVNLNTYVSQADMEKAQKYMGGLSGIADNNNYYEKETDDFWVSSGVVCFVIVLTLVVSFFNWLGGVISDLWAKGIIQTILAIIGMGGIGVGVYKLYDNGFFEKIEEYFQKKKIAKKKKQKNISKVKSNEKVVSKVINNKEKRDVADTVYKCVKNFAITTTAITMLGVVGYHIVDQNEFNGQKLCLYKKGRVEGASYYPHREFNTNLEVLINSKSSKNIMYDVLEERKWNEPNNYILDNINLKKITNDNIDNINSYIRTGSFSGRPRYYHLDKTLYPFLDTFDVELIEVFNDYRNAIVYYASNNNQEELKKTLESFYIDCDLMFTNEHTYELGNPIVRYCNKFKDASSLAKMVALEICDSLLSIEYQNNNEIYCYSNRLSIGYNVDIQEIREFVESNLPKLRERVANREYVKYYWRY